MAALLANTVVKYEVFHYMVCLAVFATNAFYLFTRVHFMVYKGVVEKEGYSFSWSLLSLLADFLRVIIVLLAFPVWKRQITTFHTESVPTKATQKIHCIVATYKEPVETVRKCIQHLLDAEMPYHSSMTIYLGDDGSAFEDGRTKQLMCEELFTKGYPVIYVGDRIKNPSVQLNGKSANINHIINTRIYPHGSEFVDHSDVLMVMDCDHLVTREFFNKVCSVMIDPKNAVCLVPQAFHNTLEPDFLDNANKMFMYGLLPYFFGLGSTFITGTNFMVRSKAAFCAAILDVDGQIFSERLVAEDVHLGSRLHFLGYHSVVLNEELAYGEVPLPPREIFKQRNRWAKAGHMYILDDNSVFRRTSPYMGWYSKLTYCAPMIIHVISFISEPITILAPPVCLLTDLCPFGMSRSLWISHFMAIASGIFLICLPTFCKPWRFIYNHVSNRVQLMVSMKAVVNTMLVMSKMKKPSCFKTSMKSGSTMSLTDQAISVEVRESKNYRKEYLPYDGTIDIWYITSVCSVCLLAAGIGIRKLYLSDELISAMGTSQSNLYLLSIVLCLWESLPGLCFIWYCIFWERAAWTLKIWVPFVCGTVALMIVFIEARLGYQYLGGSWDYFYGYDHQYASA